MDVVHGLEQFPRRPGPTVLAPGTFDGVHRGHQGLIRAAVLRAHELGGRSVVLTFDPHPLQVIAPPPDPYLLTTLEERIAHIAALGVDIVLVVRFDAALREKSADAWIELLVHHVGITDVFTSLDYTFGKNRSGTVEVLRQRGARLGFAVHTMPPVQVDGVLVSSTLIRRLLRSGAVHDAVRYLGRWYGVTGVVIAGSHRGTALGFPTANLQVPETKILPARGAYAGFVTRGAVRYEGALSVGTRPTFGPGPIVVEAYILDFTGELYGERLAIEFVDRLHEDIAFPNQDALIRQLHDDVATTRQRLRVAGIEQLC